VVFFCKSDEILQLMAAGLAEVGLSLAVHAIGDRAVHEVLDGFAPVCGRMNGSMALPALRQRMEHVQTILRRMPGAWHDWISSPPCNRSMPLRYAYGGPVAGRKGCVFLCLAHPTGAWRPAWRLVRCAVESANPFHGIHAAVTRRRADGSPGPEVGSLNSV